MQTVLYLIRHAQSQPTSRLHYSEWPLTSVGERQAAELAGVLAPLAITRLTSSPFTRCLQTVEPFARQAGIPVILEDDLRERLVVQSIVPDFAEIWRRSWEDFTFALPGCETSLCAQQRFIAATTRTADAHPGEVIAVSTHGNVIGLFLNGLDPRAGRPEAEALTNPDVVKVVRRDGLFRWDRSFSLLAIEQIATDHRETPAPE